VGSDSRSVARSGEEAAAPAKLRRHLALTALLRVFDPRAPDIGTRLAAIPRMLAATWRGDYDGGIRVARMVLAALYLFSPLELIADVVFLVVGVVGNAGLATWLAGALLDETERFLTWESRRRRPPPASTSVPDLPAPARRDGAPAWR
jgi:hypothetical protein